MPAAAHRIVVDQSTVAPARRAWWFSPWGLTLLFGIVLPFSLVGSLALVLWQLSNLHRDNAKVLPDGSVLVLEKVTRGKDHHFVYSSPAWPYLFKGPEQRLRGMPHGSADECLMLWFTRRTPDGRHLDLGWWKDSLAVDRNGITWLDSFASLDEWDHATKTLGRHRSGRPLRYDPSFPFHVVHSQMRMFRPRDDGTFDLQVYNTADEVVATFVVRMPPGPAPAELVADVLPATKSIGALTMTLQSCTARELEGQNSHSPVQPWRNPFKIDAEVKLESDGVVTQDWNWTLETVSDPLGNRSSPELCDLSPLERWRLTYSAVRKETASFPPAMTDVVAIAAPLKDSLKPVGNLLGIGGVTVQLQFAGRGSFEEPATHHFPSYRTFIGLKPQPPFSDSFIIEGKTRRSDSTVVVACEAPFLALRVTGLKPGERFLLRSRTANGEIVHWKPQKLFGTELWVGDAADSQTTIELTAIVNRPETFEFVVGPVGE